MDIKQSMRDILAAESRAIANIPVTDGYEQAVKLIVEQVKNRGGKLVTSGMGKCGQIAENIATTFSSTGIPAVFLHPSEAQHGDLGVLQQNDVMLLLSNSGRTSEILALVDLAQAPTCNLLSSPVMPTVRWHTEPTSACGREGLPKSARWASPPPPAPPP